MASTYEDFAQSLLKKRKATEQDLALYRTVGEERVGMVVGDCLVKLDSLKQDDQMDAEELSASERDNPFWDMEGNVPECEEAPDTVDRRQSQTTIKHQQDRGTCVCFASLACLEAILNRQSAEKASDPGLSEQYANWLYMRFEERNQCDDGLRTTLSARYLSQKGVCEESLAPYEDDATVNTHCEASPSQEALDNAKYGIERYTIIDRLGLNGPSIANTDYLECVLSLGYDIVFGTHVAWGLSDPVTGINDVVLDPYGNPLPSRGGHAMLIVGYVKNVDTPYFILKNSWGTDDGNEGYRYLSYDYIRQYAKYGYIVHAIGTDMPTE